MHSIFDQVTRVRFHVRASLWLSPFQFRITVLNKAYQSCNKTALNDVVHVKQNGVIPIFTEKNRRGQC